MQRLIDEKILTKEPNKEIPIPWFAHFFIIFVSVIGGLLLIALLAVLKILTEDNAHIFGIISILMALYINKNSKDDINTHHILLVMIIFGEVGLAMGVYELTDKNFTFILIALLQIPLFFLIKNYLQRVLNILIFTLSLLFIKENSVLFTLFSISYFASIIYLTLYEKRFFNQDWLYSLKNGLIITLFTIIIIKVFKYHNVDRYTLILLAGLLALYTQNRLSVLYEIKNYYFYLITLLLIALFYPTPELIITFTILALTLYQKDYFFSFLSIVVSIFFIVFWYYNVTFSLLYKSISMILIGVTLLSIYYIRSRYAKNSDINNLFTL